MVEAVVQYKRLDGVTDTLGKIATSVLRQPAPVEISSALKTLAERMLVIRGIHDNIVSEGQEPLGARVETLINSGHMPHMEEPERVNALLLEHFAKADVAGAGVQ
jgi:pimeloyl-ACP methyl ester carboxylesterase